MDNLRQYLTKLTNEAMALDNLINKTELQVSKLRAEYESLLAVAAKLEGEELGVFRDELNNVRNNFETIRVVLNKQIKRYNDLLVLIRVIENELNI